MQIIKSLFSIIKLLLLYKSTTPYLHSKGTGIDNGRQPRVWVTVLQECSLALWDAKACAGWSVQATGSEAKLQGSRAIATAWANDAGSMLDSLWA